MRSNGRNALVLAVGGVHVVRVDGCCVLGGAAMTDVWRLQIQLTGGSAWIIHGTEELMREGFEGVHGAMLAGDMPSSVEVHGFYNSADRAEMTIVVRVSECQAIELGKMC